MVRAEFLDQEEWYEGLPGAVISAGALIINATGEPLLVKPNYRDYWSLPGGICEHGEAPHIGQRRPDGRVELLEAEIGRDEAVAGVEAHRGAIVEVGEPGEGAHFIVYLPVSRTT